MSQHEYTNDEIADLEEETEYQYREFGRISPFIENKWDAYHAGKPLPQRDWTEFTEKMKLAREERRIEEMGEDLYYALLDADILDADIL